LRFFVFLDMSRTRYLRRWLSDNAAPWAAYLHCKVVGTAPVVISTTRADVVEDLESLELDWRALAAVSDNVFATWEWLHTWWCHFGRDRPIRCVVCRGADGRPFAIWPLYLARRRPIRVLRFLGHGPTDQLGPVCDPRHRAAAAAGLGQVIAGGMIDADIFLADELPATDDWVGLLGGRRIADQASPVVVMRGAPGEWLEGRSRGLRSQLRRCQSRLESSGAVVYRCTALATDVLPDMVALRTLHDSRWQVTGGSRAFAGRERFHDDFAQLAFERGWLRLRFLDLDGHPIAGVYNLRFCDAEYFYQSGRDPSCAALSVGLLMHAHAIDEATRDGCTEYRMLRGAEPYKMRFADRDDRLVSATVSPTAMGRLVHPAVARIGGLPRWAIRRVPASIAWGTGGSPVWGPP